jgi:polysaccharide pyruvyl transferase WcaK-like protein
MKTITVLGNYSGRNAGDAAILGGLVRDISARHEGVTLKVPTINSGFIRRAFANYNIKPISLLPWTLSIKILGLPTFWTTLHSDLVLVTDAILFERKLYNPLYNYLWTLSKVLPKAKKKNIPVILYNCSLGPVTSNQGRKCLKKVIKSAEVLVLRDMESLELLKTLDIRHTNIRMGADCALNAIPSSNAIFNEICKREKLFKSDRPVIGFNVNSYVDAYVRQNGKAFGRQRFVSIFAETVDRTIDELNVDVIFIETQHMDMGIANEVMAKIRNRDRIRLVSNVTYSYEDICAVLKRLELFVGMRTHSLILSTAMGVPAVGVMTYPKNRGYMKTIGQDECLIEFNNLTTDQFFDLISKTWSRRKEIRQILLPKVEAEKKKAQGSAAVLAPYLQN